MVNTEVIMIIEFTFSNVGAFKNPVTLSFEASNDKHLAPAYVREISLENNKKIKLLRMAMIYGANAAGKTTILEVLSLLDELVTSPQIDSEAEIDINTFAFQANASEQPSCISVKFVRSATIYQYHIHLVKAGILYEKLEYKKTQFNAIYERKRAAIESEFVIKYGVEHKLNKSEQEKLNAELLPNVTMLSVLNRKMNTQNEYVKEAYKWFKEQMMGEVTTKTNLEDWTSRLLVKNLLDKEPLLETLNRAGIPIKELEFVSRSFSQAEKKAIEKLPDEFRTKILEEQQSNNSVNTLYEVNQEIYSLSLDKQESLGTKRYYGLAALLSRCCQDDAPSRILPIDEIEHSLHPDLLEQFITSFLNDSGNSQLIATTHYRELLQDKLLFRDDVIWFVDKDNESLSSDLYCLEDVKSAAGLRATSSAYNFYKLGRLGAVPKLKV